MRSRIVLLPILLAGFVFSIHAQKPPPPVPSTTGVADFMGTASDGKYTNECFEIRESMAFSLKRP